MEEVLSELSDNDDDIGFDMQRPINQPHRHTHPDEYDVTRQEFSNTKAMIEAVIDIIKISTGLDTESIILAIKNVDTYGKMEGPTSEILKLRQMSLVKLLKEHTKIQTQNKNKARQNSNK